jgi:hypothetical protein
MPTETAAVLQNKEVTVEGTVMRAQKSGMLDPTLRITSITVDGADIPVGLTGSDSYGASRRRRVGRQVGRQVASVGSYR